MPNQLIRTTLRAKKLGALIYDARLAVRRTPEDCAQAVGVPLESFLKFESGELAPSLPELESLSKFLNVSVSHFWGNQSLSEQIQAKSIQDLSDLHQLHDRIIGGHLRQERENQRFSPADIENETGISAAKLESYENGLEAVPVPELESIASFLGIPINSFFSQESESAPQEKPEDEPQPFEKMTPEIREFIQKPVNLPYIELAKRLSEMSVEKLRAIAEGLLEITY